MPRYNSVSAHELDEQEQQLNTEKEPTKSKPTDAASEKELISGAEEILVPVVQAKKKRRNELADLIRDTQKLEQREQSKASRALSLASKQGEKELNTQKKVVHKEEIRNIEEVEEPSKPHLPARRRTAKRTVVNKKGLKENMMIPPSGEVPLHVADQVVNESSEEKCKERSDTITDARKIWGLKEVEHIYGQAREALKVSWNQNVVLRRQEALLIGQFWRRHVTARTSAALYISGSPGFYPSHSSLLH